MQLRSKPMVFAAATALAVGIAVPSAVAATGHGSRPSFVTPARHSDDKPETEVEHARPETEAEHARPEAAQENEVEAEHGGNDRAATPATPATPASDDKPATPATPATP